jgi:hypothetical protein
MTITYKYFSAADFFEFCSGGAYEEQRSSLSVYRVQCSCSRCHKTIFFLLLLPTHPIRTRADEDRLLVFPPPSKKEEEENHLSTESTDIVNGPFPR